MRTKMDVIDRSISLISTVVSRSGRFSVRDCMEVTGLGKRAAQRYMAELEALGYVQGDESIPRGYRATEKAKQIFIVKVTAC